LSFQAVAPMSRISVMPERCSGCRICELVCTEQHFHVNNPKKAAIRVVALYPNPVIRTPIVCRQCDDPECAKACPSDAIKVAKGLVTIDPELCTNCRQCVDACPYSAIFTHDDVPTPIKCDLCSGSPRCIEACPTAALELVEELKDQPRMVGRTIEYPGFKELRVPSEGSSEMVIKYVQGGRSQ